MLPTASSHLRIARPSRDLDAAERFWVHGLGPDVLWRTAPGHDGDHDLLMVGWPTAAWHPELVADPDGTTPPAPTEEDLLVLYLGAPADEQLLDHLTAAGGACVTARNPYWEHWPDATGTPEPCPPRQPHRPPSTSDPHEPLPRTSPAATTARASTSTSTTPLSRGVATTP